MGRQANMAVSNRYSIILRPEPEGGYTVRVPAFPEIVTYGNNEQEAIAMAKEAIELVLESRHERREPIPAEDLPLYREVTVSISASQ
jgi:antitoxin HicB